MTGLALMAPQPEYRGLPQKHGPQGRQTFPQAHMAVISLVLSRQSRFLLSKWLWRRKGRGSAV